MMTTGRKKGLSFIIGGAASLAAAFCAGYFVCLHSSEKEKSEADSQIAVMREQITFLRGWLENEGVKTKLNSETNTLSYSKENGNWGSVSFPTGESAFSDHEDVEDEKGSQHSNENYYVPVPEVG